MNVYIGHGVRFGGVLFHPTQVGKIDKDAKGLEEHPEPNPDKEPVIVEPDTEMEGEQKEGDEKVASEDEN